ncbi:MAG: transglutaminase-like cysteine peptidase [Nitrospirae bacterium]|nr:transglutaminase-like cysteine peptidase [Magnetococcales bacterium]
MDAADQNAVVFANLFVDHPPEQDTTGRSKKLAQAVAMHQQRKPLVWTTDLATIQDLPELAKLEIVQETVNKRIAYINDTENIWQSPYDAYRTGGDCEDYAIAKLLLLKESAFPENNLRLITLAPDATHQFHHVFLLAKAQNMIYVLDSPNRTKNGELTILQEYTDAARPVIWAGWTGGFSSTSQPLGNIPPGRIKNKCFNGFLQGQRCLPSYRQYPAKEKLVRIAADLLIIHYGEPRLTPAEIERLRILRIYFYDPTPKNAESLTAYEVRMLSKLRK